MEVHESSRITMDIHGSPRVSTDIHRVSMDIHRIPMEIHGENTKVCTAWLSMSVIDFFVVSKTCPEAVELAPAEMRKTAGCGCICSAFRNNSVLGYLSVKH